MTESILTITAEITNVPDDEAILQTEQMTPSLNDFVLSTLTFEEQSLLLAVRKIAGKECGHRTYNDIFQVYFRGGVLCEYDTRPDSESLRIILGDGSSYSPWAFPKNTVEISNTVHNFSREIENSASCFMVPANVQRLPENLRIA